jgi:hypothetical protein
LGFTILCEYAFLEVDPISVLSATGILLAAYSFIILIKLLGRISVQCSSVYLIQACRMSGPCMVFQPAGISMVVGQSECWPSSFIKTK